MSIRFSLFQNKNYTLTISIKKQCPHLLFAFTLPDLIWINVVIVDLCISSLQPLCFTITTVPAHGGVSLYNIQSWKLMRSMKTSECNDLHTHTHTHTGSWQNCILTLGVTRHHHLALCQVSSKSVDKCRSSCGFRRTHTRTHTHTFDQPR
jgi:hypothetical protein